MSKSNTHPRRAQKFVVTTVHGIGDEPISTRKVGRYSSIAGALKAAHIAAASDADAVNYGPSSLAIVGETVTAVVAW